MKNPAVIERERAIARLVQLRLEEALILAELMDSKPAREQMHVIIRSYSRLANIVHCNGANDIRREAAE